LIDPSFVPAGAHGVRNAHPSAEALGYFQIVANATVTLDALFPQR